MSRAGASCSVASSPAADKPRAHQERTRETDNSNQLHYNRKNCRKPGGSPGWTCGQQNMRSICMSSERGATSGDLPM